MPPAVAPATPANRTASGLRSDVQGRVVLPGDRRSERACRVRNGMVAGLSDRVRPRSMARRYDPGNLLRVDHDIVPSDEAGREDGRIETKREVS